MKPKISLIDLNFPPPSVAKGQIWYTDKIYFPIADDSGDHVLVVDVDGETATTVYASDIDGLGDEYDVFVEKGKHPISFNRTFLRKTKGPTLIKDLKILTGQLDEQIFKKVEDSLKIKEDKYDWQQKQILGEVFEWLQPMRDNFFNYLEQESSEEDIVSESLPNYYSMVAEDLTSMTNDMGRWKYIEKHSKDFIYLTKEDNIEIILLPIDNKLLFIVYAEGEHIFKNIQLIIDKKVIPFKNNELKFESTDADRKYTFCEHELKKNNAEEIKIRFEHNQTEEEIVLII